MSGNDIARPEAGRIGMAPENAVAVVIILFVFAVWEVVVRSGLTAPTSIPTPSYAIRVLWEMSEAGTLWKHTSASLLRITSGYLLAVGFGIPVGFLIAWFEPVRKYLDPLLQMFRQVPLIAWFPVFIFLFGIGELPKTLLVMLTAFWWILLSTVAAVENIDADMVKTARAVGVSHWEMFTKIVLPAIAPSVFTAARLAYTEVIMVLVAVEMLGAKAGLGTLLANDGCHAGPEHVMMYSICMLLTVMGLVANYALAALEKRVLIWKPESTD